VFQLGVIEFFSNSRNDILSQISYDSINTIKSSDHRPVFSQFELKFKYDEDSIDKHDIIDLSTAKTTKKEDEIKEIYKSSLMRDKNMGKNKSKA
jgi:hypothetical protein